MTAVVLTPQDAERMRQIDRVVRQRVETLLPGLRGGSLIVPRLHLAKTDGTGITAASGTTMGEGTVTLQTMDRTTKVASNKTDGAGSAVTETAYNFVETASGTNAFVFVVQDVDGVFWYVAEAC